MNRTILTAAALAAFVPLTAAAQTAAPTTAPATTPVVTVTDAYARSNNPDVGAAFMTITNAGTADCVLGAITADGFASPELHTHREEAGVMKMVKVDSLTVPAGAAHDLKRGGDHIMLMKPKAPVMQGQAVAMTLDFGSCGTVPVTLTVDNNAGPALGHGIMDGTQHGAHAGHGAPAGN